MRSALRRRLWVPALIVSSGASLLFAGSPARHETPQPLLNPALDSTPVIVENPADGKALAAWTYRSGNELDIAVSSRDSAGVWSRPIFIGSFDGVDQRSPALTMDAAGNAYLAFSASDSRRVFLSFLGAGTSTWSMPMPVSPEGTIAGSPALMVVGDRLVIGFRSGGRTALVQLPLPNVTPRPTGIQDGPDPVGNNSEVPVGGTPGSGPVRPGK